MMDFLIVLLMPVLRRRDGLLRLCAVDYLNSIGLLWKVLVDFIYISWRYILIPSFLINAGLDKAAAPFSVGLLLELEFGLENIIRKQCLNYIRHKTIHAKTSVVRPIFNYLDCTITSNSRTVSLIILNYI